MRALAPAVAALSLVAHAAAAQTSYAAGHAAAHAAGRAASHVTRGAREMVVVARDYAFDIPDSVPAGVTTIRLMNRGTELHHTQIIRLDGGHTTADLLAAIKAGGPPPAWARDVGGPNAPAPNGESVAALDLRPGRYAIVCFIPSADGTPHVMKGMAREFVAVAPRRAVVTPAAAAAPRTTITLRDYGFTFSRPLTAGTQTVRVRNEGMQAHEVFVVRLAPGKTAASVAQWVDKQDGPPPGLPLGGTTAMEVGAWNDVTLTLEPGKYGLLCFIPDAKDGKPHVAHGMLTEFTVAARH